MRRSLKSVLAVACLALGGFPAVAGAEVFTVNTTADQTPSPTACQGIPGDCALRQAVDLANETAGENTIVLPAGHYLLTIKGKEEEEDATGDLDVTGDVLHIQGAGARKTVIDGSGLEDRVLDVRPLASPELRLSGLTVSGGLVSNENGGGIRMTTGVLEIEGVTVAGNTAAGTGRGGGLELNEVEATILDSLFVGNRNSGDGGAMHVTGSILSIADSTIANNVVETALNPGDPGWGAYGGAMEIGSSAALLKNVTIAGNAVIDNNGGGSAEAAAINNSSTAEVEAVNTIVYGNTATPATIPRQCTDPLDSLGHNLEQALNPEETRCFEAPTDLLANPLLGPLADNGGETDTMALGAGSPAIDAADVSFCPAHDQRGVARPQLGGCDIGAFEFVPSPPPAPPAPGKPSIRKKGRVTVKAAGSTFLVRPGILVSCPVGGESCTGTLKAKAKAPQHGARASQKAKLVLVGKASFSIAAGKSLALSFKLNSRGASMLRQQGHLVAKIEVGSQAGAGPASTAKRTASLKLPPPKRRS